MVTKTRKKHTHRPPKVLTEGDREKLREVVLDWHTTTCANLANLRSVATELLGELSKCCSPLNDFFAQPDDLRDLIDHLDDAEGALTFLLVREPLPTPSTIPNPCDLLRDDAE